MKRAIKIALIFLSLYAISFGQEPADNLKIIFDDGEFFFALEEYRDALPEYMKVYKRGFDENAYLNYKIGICYTEIPGEIEKSIDHFIKAAENLTDQVSERPLRDNKAPFDTYIYLGNSYREIYEFEKAIEAYMKYIEVDEFGVKANIAYVKKEIKSCKRAIEELKTPVLVEKVNLGKPINNSNSNFRAVVSGDQKRMAYMNALPFYDAVYVSDYENGEWTAPKNITPEIVSDGDQYTTSLSNDGTVLYLTREDEFDSDVYYSVLEDGVWSKSKKLSREVNSKFWESHASISPDGTRLYFASNRRGGMGEMDIYMCILDEDGDWGPAINLGDKINTELSEDTPFPTADGKRLYFSSQGRDENMGGYDIYYVEIFADGTFGTPVHLKYPINTPGDDIFYQPIDDNSGYLSIFSKEEGEGREDIYRLNILEQGEEMAVEQKTEEVVEEQEKVEIPVKEEEIVEEVVADQVEEAAAEVEEAAEKVVEEVEEVVEESVEEVEEKTPIVQEPASTLQVEVSPLFFEFDKQSLAASAMNKLEAIVNILNDNQGVNLRVVGYADGYGDPNYNVILSKRRAQSVKDYLVSKGVAEDRIEVSGKGSVNQLVVERDANGELIWSQAQYNRRVELIFKNLPESIEIIDVKDVPQGILNSDYKKE